MNSDDRPMRPLDRAVIERVHAIADTHGTSFDTLRGVFTEGGPVYPDAGFDARTHVQIAVRDRACIEGVFRVPEAHLRGPQ